MAITRFERKKRKLIRERIGSILEKIEELNEFSPDTYDLYQLLRLNRAILKYIEDTN
jgi:hypothetical protein